MSVRSIARQLGISPTAVSLALKDNAKISPALRAKVRRVAKTLGYVPNARVAELMSEVSRSHSVSYRATLAAFSLFPFKEPWRVGYPHLKLFLDGAMQRAESHGYRLEYFWLKGPDMSPKRLRTILEARGIRGLLCLGSLDPDERFPAALESFAVVTFAASIPNELHRVSSHFTHDARLLFDELNRRDYKRPGIVIVSSGDRRTNFAYTEAFLGSMERRFAHSAIPIHRAEDWNERAFHAWFEQHRPDVVVLHQHAPYLEALRSYLRRRRIVVPRDLGLALLDLNPNRAYYSGVCQDMPLMGATAAEMLIGRVLLRDFGPPAHPKVELVVGQWNEGRTLRPAR